MTKYRGFFILFTFLMIKGCAVRNRCIEDEPLKSEISKVLTDSTAYDGKGFCLELFAQSAYLENLEEMIEYKRELEGFNSCAQRIISGLTVKKEAEDIIFNELAKIDSFANLKDVKKVVLNFPPNYLITLLQYDSELIFEGKLPESKDIDSLEAFDLSGKKHKLFEKVKDISGMTLKELSGYFDYMYLVSFNRDNRCIITLNDGSVLTFNLLK